MKPESSNPTHYPHNVNVSRAQAILSKKRKIVIALLLLVAAMAQTQAHHHRSNIKPNKPYKKSGGHSSKSELKDAAKGAQFSFFSRAFYSIQRLSSLAQDALLGVILSL
jgi:hypothetical protein